MRRSKVRQELRNLRGSIFAHRIDLHERNRTTRQFQLLRTMRLAGTVLGFFLRKSLHVLQNLIEFFVLRHKNDNRLLIGVREWWLRRASAGGGRSLRLRPHIENRIAMILGDAVHGVIANTHFFGSNSESLVYEAKRKQTLKKVFRRLPFSALETSSRPKSKSMSAEKRIKLLKKGGQVDFLNIPCGDDGVVKADHLKRALARKRLKKHGTLTPVEEGVDFVLVVQENDPSQIRPPPSPEPDRRGRGRRGRKRGRRGRGRRGEDSPTPAPHIHIYAQSGTDASLAQLEELPDGIQRYALSELKDRLPLITRNFVVNGIGENHGNPAFNVSNERLEALAKKFEELSGDDVAEEIRKLRDINAEAAERLLYTAMTQATREAEKKAERDERANEQAELLRDIKDTMIATVTPLQAEVAALGKKIRK